MAALDYEKEQFYKKYGAPGPGQELVGMKNNKAIYRDIESATPPAAQQPAQPTQPAAQQPAAPKPAQPTQPTAQQPAQPAQTAAQQPAQTGPQYSSDPELAAAQRRMQELSKRRDQEFQNKPDITNSSTTPRTTSFFNSREYAQQFRAAQAAANQRAIDRIGAPRQDRATSTTATSNAAASALRNAAAQPRVATAEQVRAAGFGPKQTERLLFTENVTPDYLERLKNRSLRNY